MIKQKKIHILIAEDSSLDRAVFSRHLEKLRKDYANIDFRFTFVDTGGQVLFYFEQDIPDVFVFDILMPEISGSSLLLRLREFENLKNKPVLLCSSRDYFDLKALWQSISDKGNVDFMTKPIDGIGFRRKISELCGIENGSR